MGKVKLAILRKQNEVVRSDLQCIILGSDERRKSCIISIAMFRLSAKGTDAVMKPGSRFASNSCLLYFPCRSQHTTEPEEVSGGAV